jgi:hypothetical protein
VKIFLAGTSFLTVISRGTRGNLIVWGLLAGKKAPNNEQHNRFPQVPSEITFRN